MTKYMRHLEQVYSSKSFGRKTDYFKYNFSEILASIGTKEFSVLEIGPGMGESISCLNTLGVKDIDIIDNDEVVLSNVRTQFKVRKTILSNNILTLRNGLGKYDLIIMIQVLEHLPIAQQGRIISMLYSHLNSKGTMVIVVPNANNPFGMTERYGDLQHKISYTNQSLRDLISESMIKNYKINITGFEIPPYSLINVVRIILQKILHLHLLLMMIINGGTYFNIMTPNIVLRIKSE
jgi:2-polyprenyl-3-methyl-5-hydroxy-6-metoxy-1,4-benzoquinol methylase